jgi:cyclase
MFETVNGKLYPQLIVLCIVLMLSFPCNVPAANYEIQKLSDSVYAAIASPDSKAVSNALFVVTGHEVILAGAHFVPEGVSDLLKEIGKITPLPVSHVILTHHHRGFNYVDFDLPEKAEILVSTQIWQELTAESREFKNANLVFEDSLTLNRGATTLVLQSMGKGHRGEASVLDWGESLERLESIPARFVIPGVGMVTDGTGIQRFKKFYRAFMTEVLRNVEKGNSLSQTKKEFSLDNYKSLPGFKTFIDVNLERSYKQLKSQ